MNDNELDDLFRSNTDYLADQPPRDFDKEAFWQQLQTAMPEKADRQKKPIVWGWAAAAVLLAGMLSGIWWMKPETGGMVGEITSKAEGTPQPLSVSPQARPDTGLWGHRPVWNTASEELAQGTPSTPRSGQNAHIPAPNSDTDKENYETQRREQPIQQVPLPAIPSRNEPQFVATQEYASSESVVEAPNPQPESVTPPVSKKPHYRVVHINEIRERKQQEAKARTRMAFRIGLPSASRLTTQSEHEAPLSISIQN